MGKEILSEYEDLLKVKNFYLENNKESVYRTFEKIKRGLSREYIENIDEKVDRWIDITINDYYFRTIPVEYYIQSKMLYRDGFYEASIIIARSICEMICYDLLKNIKHPFGNKKNIERTNFRTLVNYLFIPKILKQNDFNGINIKLKSDKDFFTSCFIFDNNIYKFINGRGKDNRNLKKLLKIYDFVGYNKYDSFSKFTYGGHRLAFLKSVFLIQCDLISRQNFVLRSCN